MASRAPTPSRLANHGARLVAGAFDDYRQRYRVISRRAQFNFERRDWARQLDDAAARLALYRDVIDHTERRLRDVLGDHIEDRLVWVSMKAVFSGRIDDRHDWDLAETFFNSVTRRIFDTVGVDPYIEFVDSDFDQPPTAADDVPWLRHGCMLGTRAMCQAVLGQRFASMVWEDPDRDARLVSQHIDAHLEAMGRAVHATAAELLIPTFYRGKGAYLVGRILTDRGLVPLVIALRNGPAGVFVDAVLFDEDDVSILFGFTRSYFSVDAPRPHDVVDFLQSLLPRKPRGELYIAIGEPKQGKTELFRDLLHHLDTQPARFTLTRGTPGLVMVVFDLPGHDVVLKVIRDHFPPQKTVSQAQVRERYAWVYAHDRAGRLVDTQSFEHLQLPRARFDAELLAELTSECSRGVSVSDEHVVIDQLYVQRRVTPLNLYVREVGPQQAVAAVLEYGRAIHDLAVCNIFPGDLLAKNFGVTRHGRVAFYDYDELVPLSTCNIRDIPQAEHVDQEMAEGAWFSVAQDDVFPEEFPRFLGLPRRLREAMMAEHRELFEPDWWREIQARHAAGKIVEIVPYDPKHRIQARRS